MPDDFDLYDANPIEPEERLVRCLGCGHRHSEMDWCDTCSYDDEQRALEQTA